MLVQLFHPFYIIVDVSALFFWLVVIFKRLEVTEEGIYIKTLPVSIDFVYSFDNTEQIKFRGPFLHIKKKNGPSSYWLMIPKEGFVEEMRRYAPQKLID